MGGLRDGRRVMALRDDVIATIKHPADAPGRRGRPNEGPLRAPGNAWHL